MEKTADQYYTVGNRQLLDIMADNFGHRAVFDFCLLNAAKYIFRCEKKHETPTDDLRKALFYISKAYELSEKGMLETKDAEVTISKMENAVREAVSKDDTPAEPTATKEVTTETADTDKDEHLPEGGKMIEPTDHFTDGSKMIEQPTTETTTEAKPRPDTAKAPKYVCSPSLQAKPKSKAVPKGFVDLGLPSGTLWAIDNFDTANKKGKFTYNEAKTNTPDGQHLPTEDDFKELTRQCKWTWDKKNKGYTVQLRKEGEKLFFPTLGKDEDNEPCGDYWTASEIDHKRCIGNTLHFNEVSIIPGNVRNFKTKLCVRYVIKPNKE